MAEFGEWLSFAADDQLFSETAGDRAIPFMDAGTERVLFSEGMEGRF